MKGVHHEKLTKGLAGVIGVVVTMVVGTAVFGGIWLVVRRRDAERAPPEVAAASEGPAAPVVT